MDTTESENNDIPQPVDRRKIKRAPWRTITLEDGTTKYNSKPNDPEYFKKYYDEKRKFHDATQLTCEYCNKCFSRVHKARHEKSKYCIKARSEKTVQLIS